MSSAVVTGAGGGLGRAIAQRLAADGHAVAVLDVDKDEAERTAELIGQASGTAQVYLTDLRDDEAIRGTMATVEADLGPIHVLVNNAAIFPAGSMLDVSAETYDDVIAVNQRAYFLAAKAVIVLMRAENRPGVIINVGSITQHGGWSEMVPYATTKGAAATMTRAMATELGQYEIRVNCVAPGAFPTRAEEMHEDQAAYSQRIIDSQALKRRGRLEDVGAAVSFLAGPDASFITGQTLNVDGGWIMT